jgi:signal transduction histidine kinase/CheY-like chemotaxis protein
MVCANLGYASGRGELNPPRAENGVINLRSWDFTHHGSVSLDGNWEFSWNQLLTPGDFAAARPDDLGFLAVPATWNRQVWKGIKLPGRGFGTYRLTVLVQPGKDFALKLLDAGQAYTLWINDKVVMQSGIVGTSKAEMQPRYKTGVVDAAPVGGVIEVVMQVSNFVYRRGGAWSSVEIGTKPQIERWREKQLLIDMCITGCLSFVGLYHLSLFILRRKDRSTLYFGAFCLLIALRVLVTGERLLHSYASWIGWSNLIRMEYLVWYLGAPLFMVFLQKLFPEVSKRVTRMVMGIMLLFSVTVAFTPPFVFSYTLPVVQSLVAVFSIYLIAAMVLSAYRKRDGSRLVLAGAIVLISTMIHDIAIANGWIRGFNLAPLGTVAFVVVQAFMLLARSANAFALAEELSVDLEKRARERTRWLRDANHEIRASNQLLKETQSQLVQTQKMEAVGTLAGGIAHEFNNILGSIVGYTEIMLSKQPPGSLSIKYLESIDRMVDRASLLVRQLLTFSHEYEQDLTPQSIQSELVEIIDMIRATMPDSIQVKDFIDPDCLPILANSTQISQITLNLCTNAKHAMSEQGGVVEIGLSTAYLDTQGYSEIKEDGDYLMLRVKDTGTGISDEIAGQIFDPFFTTKDVDQGSGLGLSVVHGIVENHHGFIRMESKLGEGTEFRIYFPTIEESALLAPSEKKELQKGSGHILVVEDDPDLSEFYKAAFDILGYRITLFHDGIDALDEFRKYPDQFDLVFSDEIMKGLGGGQMCREIAQIRSGVPIILTSGYSSSLDIEALRNQGIDFVPKPIRITEFSHKIHELISQRQRNGQVNQ